MKRAHSSLFFGYLLVVANTILFVLKLIAFLLSNSIAIFSDAINSLTDIISSVVVAYSIRIGQKKPDQGHPFGHDRVEPLAALFVALVAGFLGFDIIKSAIDRFITAETIILHPISIGVILFTIVLKSYMYWSLGKASKYFDSPSLEAGSMDARNDVFFSLLVLMGLITSTQYPIFDTIISCFLSLWILYNAYTLGKKNVDYLTGRRADGYTVEKIRSLIRRMKSVKKIKQINTHYVGNKVQVEIVIAVPHMMTVTESHHVSEHIEQALSHIPEVSKVFVHIEPNL